jgi:rubredoxin
MGVGFARMVSRRVWPVLGAREQVAPVGLSGSIQCSNSKTTPYETMTDPKTWMCLICGWIYDEAAGDPEHGIAPGTLWADVPMNWTCPECAARKEDFEMVQI